MADKKGSQDPQVPANLEDLIKAVELNPNHWTETPEAVRVKFTDRVFWQWIEKTNPMPAPRNEVSHEPPSRRWWIKNPPILECHEPGYLCEVCRHVNFKYLIDSPSEQILEEFELAPLEWVFKNEKCAFCRLVSSSMSNAVGGPTNPTQVDGKAVVCTIRTLPMLTDIHGPRVIWLMTIPPPEGIILSNSLSFYRFSSGDDHLLAEASCGQPLQSPRIDYELVKGWYQNCLDGKCYSNPNPVLRKFLPTGFRLIDVKRYCIVNFEEDFQ